MQSFTTDGDPFHSRSSSEIRPALTSFADEVCATVARLFVYVGVLALFGILGIHAWNQLQFEWAEESSLETGWSLTERASPDFALSHQDASDKSNGSKAYLVLRHPAGGRKDVLRWSGPKAQPFAELEIYRPGAEYGSPSVARAELARRMPTPGSRRDVAELETAGTLESKFGSVGLLRPAGTRAGAASCLGFLKRIDEPALQISGWSCQGDSLSLRRADIDCMLSRVVLARSGNEPKLAQLFARAELAPGSCPSVTVSADWMTGAGAPSLRGSL
jgi:hypothetical protein